MRATTDKEQTQVTKSRVTLLCLLQGLRVQKCERQMNQKTSEGLLAIFTLLLRNHETALVHGHLSRACQVT